MLVQQAVQQCERMYNILTLRKKAPLPNGQKHAKKKVTIVCVPTLPAKKTSYVSEQQTCLNHNLSGTTGPPPKTNRPQEGWSFLLLSKINKKKLKEIKNSQKCIIMMSSRRV